MIILFVNQVLIIVIIFNYKMACNLNFDLGFDTKIEIFVPKLEELIKDQKKIIDNQ